MRFVSLIVRIGGATAVDRFSPISLSRVLLGCLGLVTPDEKEGQGYFE